MGFLDNTPNMDTKLSAIEALRTVTEGKVGRTHPMVASGLTITRSSLKLNAPGLPEFFPISRKNKVTSNQHATSYANSKSKLSDL